MADRGQGGPEERGRPAAEQGARGAVQGHARSRGGGGLRQHVVARPLRPAQGQAAAVLGRASTSAAGRCRRVRWRGPVHRGLYPQRAAAGAGRADGGVAVF